MSIIGYLMPETSDVCPYLAGRTATMEHFVAEYLGESDLEELLAAGYRHFGTYFYRSVCRLCHQCIPIRISLSGYVFPRAGRRNLSRAARFTVRLERPHPSPEAYELYLKHKQRFESNYSDSYREFVQSFFHPFPWSYQLTVRDEGRLVAVSHVDITSKVMSAVYCYYDDSYRRESLGSLAINKEISIGIERGVAYLYLGYYVAENQHMSYKARFYPNQLLLEEGRWVDYLDSKGNLRNNIEKIEFLPRSRLQGGNP